MDPSLDPYVKRSDYRNAFDYFWDKGMLKCLISYDIIGEFVAEGTYYNGEKCTLVVIPPGDQDILFEKTEDDEYYRYDMREGFWARWSISKSEWDLDWLDGIVESAYQNYYQNYRPPDDRPLLVILTESLVMDVKDIESASDGMRVLLKVSPFIFLLKCFDMLLMMLHSSSLGYALLTGVVIGLLLTPVTWLAQLMLKSLGANCFEVFDEIEHAGEYRDAMRRRYVRRQIIFLCVSLLLSLISGQMLPVVAVLELLGLNVSLALPVSETKKK